MTRRMIGTSEAGRPVGQYSPLAKLSDAEVDRMLELHESTRASYRALAEMFKCSIHTAKSICLGRRRPPPTNWRAA